MKISDFKIGKKFWMSGKPYVCADIGTRCIVACPYDVGTNIKYTCSWYMDGKNYKETRTRVRTEREYKNLFPEGLEMIVIGRYDLPACQKRKTKFQHSLEKEWNKRK